MRSWGEHNVNAKPASALVRHSAAMTAARSDPFTGRKPSRKRRAESSRTRYARPDSGPDHSIVHLSDDHGRSIAAEGVFQK
jgi:hypothetical protein